MHVKKQNLGFSLVELIVVILIMAVIAVTLAPQVVRWVGEAGKSVDDECMDDIHTCVNSALAEYLAKGNTLQTEQQKYYIQAAGLSTTAGTHSSPADTDGLAKLIDEAMQSDYPEVITLPDKVYGIAIAPSGTVTVTVEAGAY